MACGIGMCVAIDGNLLINYSHQIQMPTLDKATWQRRKSEEVSAVKKPMRLWILCHMNK
ncbi:unnamed protein product [Sphenostylis stenocarpa]|uniref:Uncharacterized protein n=1 Tax=Sphenostylis stenocarpa TaxID=92480 RepID=A0AA86VPF8_9FABA|nr:unnamed protein product [Sphenostylis stenocarpa]